MNDRKRTARVRLCLYYPGSAASNPFYMECKCRQHPPVSGRDPEYYIQASGNKYRLQHYMGNPSAQDPGCHYPGRSPVRIRISPADLFQ